MATGLLKLYAQFCVTYIFLKKESIDFIRLAKQSMISKFKMLLLMGHSQFHILTPSRLWVEEKKKGEQENF